MFNLYKLTTILILAVLITPFSKAQYGTEGFQLGVQGNALYPVHDFSREDFFGSYQFSYLGRAFLRFGLFTEGLQLELGGGYGKYAGKDFVDDKFEAEIIPIDARFVVSPFDLADWNPFIYFGAGGMKFKVKDFPVSRSRYDTEDDDWAAYYPIGAGAQFEIAENLLVEANLGLIYTLTEGLNYYNKHESAGDAAINLGIGLTYNSDANDDEDMDGLFKRDEKALGTDPENPDSDGDGLNDGSEVNTYITMPLNADSDGDQLKDGEEVNQFRTNPLKPDTDEDLLNDNEEVSNYRTDPLKADTDIDGLNDNLELLTYKTDPLNADTDTDGLNDGNEVNIHKTDPLKRDTDGEGLSDGDEINVHKSDPLNVDTDGGTADDFTEAGRETNLLDPGDDVIKVGVPMVLEGITFESGKAAITPESETTLQEVLRTLNSYPEIKVEIAGHTDDQGSANSNWKLSERRAQAVKDWLVAKGVSADRIKAAGYGEDQPLVSNDTPENRQKNRRIEFKRIE